MKLALGLLLALTACQAPLVSHPYKPQDAADSTFKIVASADLDGITVPAWSGTAWIADSGVNGSLLLTAGHVCRPEADEKLTFTIEDRFGFVKEAELHVVRISDDYDLCLLGTSEFLGTPLELSKVEPKYDDDVMMVGAPLGVWGCTSEATIQECGLAPISRGHYAGGTLVSMPATHGYSGSAVLTEFGVIGVLVEGYEGYDSLSFVEPLAHLREFLSEK